MSERQYQGLLAVGDPHLSPRVPGFRKDDYPAVVLSKLRWCVAHAREHSLLPVILGDLFDLPRDNSNWLLGELMDLFTVPVIGIFGNHDCRENTMNENDSISVMAKADRLRLLGGCDQWRGRMAGRDVIIGGTPWGQLLPDRFDVPEDEAGARPLVIWLAHHDVLVPGYDEGRFKPHEIPGIDIVINGHIHRHLADVAAGGTAWMTPGNISRRNRGDATRLHVPAALRIDVTATEWRPTMVEVPHEPFHAVFHEEVIELAQMTAGSAFVAGLAELQARRTDTGAGLMAFLAKNIAQFDAAVAAEILRLAREVTADG